jgi:chromosome segregation ATPase
MSEIERLRRTLQLHAGDVASLSGELDEWRERALAAEAEIERLREEISGLTAALSVTWSISEG